MAAFWGFLTALVCTVMFVLGVVAGYYLKSHSEKSDKPKVKVNYSAPYYAPDPVNQYDAPRYEILGEGDFYSADLPYDTLYYYPDEDDVQPGLGYRRAKLVSWFFGQPDICNKIRNHDNYIDGNLYILDHEAERLYGVIWRDSSNESADNKAD